MALIRAHDPFSGHADDEATAWVTPLAEDGLPTGAPWPMFGPVQIVPVPVDEPPAPVQPTKPARRKRSPRRRRPTQAELDKALREMG